MDEKLGGDIRFVGIDVDYALTKGWMEYSIAFIRYLRAIRHKCSALITITTELRAKLRA